MLNAALQTLGVGYKQVVAHQLHLGPQPFGQLLPAVPIVLGQAVLNGDNRIFAQQILVVVNHLGGSHHFALAGQVVLTVLVHLTSRHVQSQAHVHAGLVAGLFNSLHNHLQGLLVGAQVGGKAALVAHCGNIAAVFQHCFQVMENFRPHAQSLLKAGRTHRHHHKFLNIHVVVRVLAAVQNVHHRHRQGFGVHAAQVTIQRHAKAGRRSFSCRQGNAQNSVCAQPPLVGGAVQLNQQLVQRSLVKSREPLQLRRNNLQHIVHRLAGAFAQVTLFVAVAQLHRLMHTGRRAGGYGRPANAAVLQQHLHLHSRVGPAIQNLACVYV